MKHVKIENPAPGGFDHTHVNRARRYVKKGRAAWVVVDRIIRFLTSAEIEKPIAVEPEAVRQSAIAAIQREITGREYDKHVPTGKLRRREAKRIPFAGDISKLGLA